MQRFPVFVLADAAMILALGGVARASGQAQNRADGTMEDTNQRLNPTERSEANLIAFALSNINHSPRAVHVEENSRCGGLAAGRGRHSKRRT